MLSGKTGEKYTSTEGSFENMQLSASTGNTSGEFSDVPEYVIYKYDEKTSGSSDDGNKKKIAGILGITALVTGAAAISAAILRNKKKRR